jgi:hypothetical protein
MKRNGAAYGVGQRGLAMVEFAIVLPLLLLLLLAIGEIGRMMFQYNTLLQASRDASRYLAGEARNRTLGQLELSTELLTRTRALAVYGVPVASGSTAPLVSGLTSGAVQVSAVGSDHVQVSISYLFVPVVGRGIPALFGGELRLGFPLGATTVMRVL